MSAENRQQAVTVLAVNGAPCHVVSDVFAWDALPDVLLQNPVADRCRPLVN